MTLNKKYIKHILIGFCIGIICLVIIPISINKLILKPHLFETIGTGVDWLTFWGSYLGAIISAGVAFIILHIQRKDNEKDNNDNRENNKTQNEANRQLQLNIMRYQQEIHWLDNFRSASLEYCNALNHNDIVSIYNIIWDYPNDAFNMLKPLFDRIIETNTKLSFVRKQNPKANELAKYIDDIYIAYKQTLNDLQWIAIYFRTNIPNCRYQDGFIKFLQMHKRTHDDIDHILELSQQLYYNVNHRKYFDDIIKDVIYEAKKYEPNVRDKIYEYIKQEQTLIDSLLTENIK